MYITTSIALILRMCVCLGVCVSGRHKMFFSAVLHSSTYNCRINIVNSN